MVRVITRTQLWRLVSVAALAGLLFFTGGSVQGEEPNYDNPEIRRQLFTVYRNAGDPLAYLASLSPAAQQAILREASGEGGKQTVTVTFGRYAELPAELGAALAAASVEDIGAQACYWAEVYRDQNSPLGFDLWEYHQVINWCHDGTNVTYTSWNAWGQTQDPTWSWEGVVGSSSSGGVGYSWYDQWSQGHFRQCIPLFGCLDNRYPWIEMEVYGYTPAWRFRTDANQTWRWP